MFARLDSRLEVQGVKLGSVGHDHDVGTLKHAPIRVVEAFSKAPIGTVERFRMKADFHRGPNLACDPANWN
jgi:hypothetical protein